MVAGLIVPRASVCFCGIPSIVCLSTSAHNHQFTTCKSSATKRHTQPSESSKCPTAVSGAAAARSALSLMVFVVIWLRTSIRTAVRPGPCGHLCVPPRLCGLDDGRDPVSAVRPSPMQHHPPDARIPPSVYPIRFPTGHTSPRLRWSWPLLKTHACEDTEHVNREPKHVNWAAAFGQEIGSKQQLATANLLCPSHARARAVVVPALHPPVRTRLEVADHTPSLASAPHIQSRRPRHRPARGSRRGQSCRRRNRD